MNIQDIIEKKALNKALNKDEIIFFVKSFLDKELNVKNYQQSALLMAIRLNSMNDDEIFHLTEATLNSGKILEFKSKKIIIDKHSTGGVGDKVTLILVPILSSLGFAIAKVSGRGLGITGGTIDKLESITGFNFNLNFNDINELLNKKGIALGSQSTDIALAEKFIYRLRDVTQTTASVPLIVSGIMAKKIAIKSDYLILDVKYGQGALMKTESDAFELSKKLISIAEKFNRKARATTSNMNQPLGRTVGNAIEIVETMQFLKNKNTDKGLSNLIRNITMNALLDNKIVETDKEALKMYKNTIVSGKAYEIFLDWIRSQGGDIENLQSKKFFNPKYKFELKAAKECFVKKINALKVAKAASILGASRLNMETPLDYKAGVFLAKTYTEKIKNGEVYAILYSTKPIKSEAIELVKEAFEFYNKADIFKTIKSKTITANV